MKRRSVPTNTNAKSGDIKDAMARYGMGRRGIEEIARGCKATFRVGRLVRYNFTKMDAYIDELTQE